MGRASCLATGKWGACEATRVVVKSTGGLRMAAMGDAGPCADPCSPYCTSTTDNGTGIALPNGLVEQDGGLTLEPAPPPPNSCTDLTITPSSAPATDITVTSMSALATKTFTSKLLPVDCNPSAPPALWYTDKFDIAQMSDSTPGLLTVVVPIAGPVTVGAKLGAFTATATANIVVSAKETSVVNPPPSGVSYANFPAEKGSDQTDTNLSLLYPYDGTVFPLSLQAPLLQWKNSGVAANKGVVVTLQYPPTGTPIFSVSYLASESMTAPVPLRAAQPRFPIPQSAWFAFEQTIHRNRATYGSTGRISVRRRVGTRTYKSKFIDVSFATGQLKGTVYYNSYGTALVNNYSGAQQSTGGAFAGGSFGAATLKINLGSTSPSATVAAGYAGGGGCMVCHSASASGATLLTAKEGNDIYKFNLPGTAPNAGTYFGSSAFVFAGINPTSTRVLTSSGGYLGDSSSRLFDMNGALVSSNMPSKVKGANPAFSHDGAHVAFTWMGGSASPLASGSGNGRALVMVDFNGAATFSNFRTLVDPAYPTVWPSFLPSGQNGVVYELETRTTPDGGFGYTRHDCECSTYAGALGELWWVSTGASPVATRLNRLNGYTASGTNDLPSQPSTGHAVFGGTAGPAGAGFVEQSYNYEPTVLPQTTGGYSWVMFTSRRQYGNVATINPFASDPRYDNISIDPTPKKLWVSALATGAAPGADPSAPAFYLPGQELIAGNSKPVFALEACHPAVTSSPGPTNLCDSDLDCCGGGTTSSCVLDPPPLANPPVKHCILNGGGTCRAVGESCLQTSQCCNAAGGGVCANGVCADPPPYFPDQMFTRDFTSTCPAGNLTRWTTFEWQSATPSDSRIEFFAQEGDGTTWSPSTPVAIGVARGATVTAPNWATSGVPVATALGTSPATSSNPLLRITLHLYANSDHSKNPILYNWRQSVECIPNE
jgi:hypothetical protein